MVHKCVRKILLTSCLVSSALFPRASLAAEARSPIPRLLSLAISVQTVSWRLTSVTEGWNTLVALLLDSSWGTLEALETLVNGVPFPSGLVDTSSRSRWRIGEGSLDGIHSVCERRDLVVLFDLEGMLFGDLRFVICDLWFVV